MSRPPKEGWNQKVTAAVYKLFDVIRGILDILKKIIQQAMRTVVAFFMNMLQIITDPSSPCFTAIIILVLVGMVAAYQWAQIGLWFGRLMGMPRILGWGFATIGMLAGLGINIEQLSPQLWKININLAKAFQKMGLNPEHEGNPNDIGERIKNWHSFDFQLAKKGRIVSYALESGLVVSHLFLTGLSLVSLVIAAISLVAPEFAVKNLAAKAHTLGMANDLAMQEESGDNTGSPRGGAKGGFDGMPPMGKGGGRPPGRELEM